jgi:hypothetical protein
MELSMIGRSAADFAEKLLSALRFAVGGHQDNAAALNGGA